MGTGIFNSTTGFSEEDIREVWGVAKSNYFWLKLTARESGYCEFDAGGTCTEDSMIQAIVNISYSSIAYSWTVTGASMENANGQDYCVISTPQGDSDVEYTVRLDIEVDGVSAYTEGIFTHEKVLAPIRILGIDESISGSCEL